LLQQTLEHQTWFGHEPVAAAAQIQLTMAWKLTLLAVSHTALHSQTFVVLAVSLFGHRHCFLYQHNVIVTCCMTSSSASNSEWTKLNSKLSLTAHCLKQTLQQAQWLLF